MEPLEAIVVDTGELLRECPPRWQHASKQELYRRICNSAEPFSGTMRYARWPAIDLPTAVVRRSHCQLQPSIFSYQTSLGSVDWHLNFADEELFVAYDSELLAQDELQVLEHPSLGALKEYLLTHGVEHTTISRDGKPAPVTITGVQRCCAFDTLPNPGAGRPGGLYGNAFSSAPLAKVLAATQILSPPTVSNILAIAALPSCGEYYTREQIAFMLQTAYSGFLAAKRESENLAHRGTRVVVHTGFWGCGAYGGDRELMTILQLLAADLADVDLTFHAFNPEGVQIAEDARQRYEEFCRSMHDVMNVIDVLAADNYRWGESDGN